MNIAHARGAKGPAKGAWRLKLLGFFVGIGVLCSEFGKEI
jgi:hypothetical protein